MDTAAKIFVTGSTGFIGAKLVDKLLARGFQVRGLTRKPKESKNEKLEYVVGDITDIESLRRGMKDCRYVFHLAAYAKSWAPKRSMFEEMNIDGTRNVYTVARDYGVERIVWTSTIVTLGPSPKGVVIDESTPRITDKFYTDYERTKTEMERESARWVKEGLPLVIVNPTRVFGPGLLSESNTIPQLIAMHRRGMVPILFNRGINVGNYVLVDDVAEGHILAMERGRIGERYLLGGDNASLKEIFQLVDRIDGKKRFQLPILWVWPLVVAGIVQARANLFGVYPPFTIGWLRTFLVDWAVSCEKAKRELGYTWTPFEEGIRKTCDWLTEGIPQEMFKEGVSWSANQPGKQD